jgi:hypothetical protein
MQKKLLNHSSKNSYILNGPSVKNTTVFEVVLVFKPHERGDAPKKGKKNKKRQRSPRRRSKKHSKWIALGGLNKNTLNRPCIDRFFCSSRMDEITTGLRQGLDALHPIHFFLHDTGDD